MVLWGGKLCWAQLASSGLSLAWLGHFGICGQFVGDLAIDWPRMASFKIWQLSDYQLGQKK